MIHTILSGALNLCVNCKGYLNLNIMEQCLNLVILLSSHPSARSFLVNKKDEVFRSLVTVLVSITSVSIGDNFETETGLKAQALHKILRLIMKMLHIDTALFQLDREPLIVSLTTILMRTARSAHWLPVLLQTAEIMETLVLDGESADIFLTAMNSQSLHHLPPGSVECSILRDFLLQINCILDSSRNCPVPPSLKDF
jgi:hypothetical protein